MDDDEDGRVGLASAGGPPPSRFIGRVTGGDVGNQEVVDGQEPESVPDEPRHRPTLAVVDEARPDQSNPSASPRFEVDPPGRERVLDPLRLGAVGQGERHGPAVRAGEGQHRRAVEIAGPTPDVDDAAEPRQIPDDRIEQAIGDPLVEPGDAASEWDRHRITVPRRPPGSLRDTVGWRG